MLWIYWLIGMSEMIVDWLLEYNDNDNSLLKVTKINNNNHDCSIIKRDKYFNILIDMEIRM